MELKNFTGVLHFNGEEVATKSDLSTIFDYKGQVSTFGDLPTEELKVGNVWDVADTGKNFAWNGTTWDDLGGIVDLSNYVTISNLETILLDYVEVEVGKLSENDLTDVLKSNYDTAYGWGNHATENYLKSITKAMVEAELTGTITSHDHDGTYEPAFTKNTAFNKDFGITTGTVAQGR